MLKIKFALIAVIAFSFLFISCVQDLNDGKFEDVIPSELSKGNNDDQGEDEDNGENPPIVIPPEPVTLPEKYKGIWHIDCGTTSYPVLSFCNDSILYSVGCLMRLEYDFPIQSITEALPDAGYWINFIDTGSSKYGISLIGEHSIHISINDDGNLVIFSSTHPEFEGFALRGILGKHIYENLCLCEL